VKYRFVVLGWLFPLLLGAESLADYYFERELYFEAVTEYKRQLFCRLGDPDEWLYKMALAYYRADQKGMAEEPLLVIITGDHHSSFERESLKLLARIHWDHYHYEAMLGALNLLYQMGDSLQQDYIRYISAWTQIYQAQWETAVALLAEVRFCDTQPLCAQIRNVSSVPRKSRRVAQYLSYIIPGSGQLYAADYRNAAFSFLLVGSITGSIIWNVIESAYFIAATKYLFLYSRYAYGGQRNLARKIDRDNIDRIGFYLKEVAAQHPRPLELLEKL